MASRRRRSGGCAATHPAPSAGGGPASAATWVARSVADGADRRSGPPRASLDGAAAWRPLWNDRGRPRLSTHPDRSPARRREVRPEGAQASAFSGPRTATLRRGSAYPLGIKRLTATNEVGGFRTIGPTGTYTEAVEERPRQPRPSGLTAYHQQRRHSNDHHPHHHRHRA